MKKRTLLLFIFIYLFSIGLKAQVQTEKKIELAQLVIKNKSFQNEILSIILKDYDAKNNNSTFIINIKNGVDESVMDVTITLSSLCNVKEKEVFGYFELDSSLFIVGGINSKNLFSKSKKKKIFICNKYYEIHEDKLIEPYLRKESPIWLFCLEKKRFRFLEVKYFN